MTAITIPVTVPPFMPPTAGAEVAAHVRLILMAHEGKQVH